MADAYGVLTGKGRATHAAGSAESAAAVDRFRKSRRVTGPIVVPP
jgi:hypothetical protein